VLISLQACSCTTAFRDAHAVGLTCLLPSSNLCTTLHAARFEEPPSKKAQGSWDQNGIGSRDGWHCGRRWVACGRIGPRRQTNLLPPLPVCLHNTLCFKRAVLGCVLLRAQPSFNKTFLTGAATRAVCISHAWWTRKWDSHPPSLWNLSWRRDTQKLRSFNPYSSTLHPLSASAHTDSPSPFFPPKKKRGAGRT